jgi:hypothetical protein
MYLPRNVIFKKRGVLGMNLEKKIKKFKIWIKISDSKIRKLSVGRKIINRIPSFWFSRFLILTRIIAVYDFRQWSYAAFLIKFVAT